MSRAFNEGSHRPKFGTLIRLVLFSFSFLSGIMWIFFFPENKNLNIKKNLFSQSPSYRQSSRVTAQSQSHCICLSHWLEFHFKCQVNSYFPEQSRDWINNKKERRNNWNRRSKRLHDMLSFTNCYFTTYWRLSILLRYHKVFPVINVFASEEKKTSLQRDFGNISAD